MLADLHDSELDLSSEDELVPDNDVLYSSTTTSDEDSIDLAPPPPVSKKGKRKKKQFSWGKRDEFASKFKQGTASSRQEGFSSESNKTLLEALQGYVNGGTFDEISRLTNQYHIQKTGKSLQTTSAEIKTVFGVSLIMGYIGMKRLLRMYWARKRREQMT